MKKIYILLAILITAGIALPATAQDITNTVTRAVVSAEKSHKQHAPAVTPVCAACGEKITDRYQHCPATGYTGLCSAQPAQDTRAYTEEDPSPVCPICGHLYTFDERYHDVKHVCPEKKAHKICAVCGEEITDPAQHCKATDYTGLCTPVKPTQPAPKQADGKSTVCPRCHQTYTIDEMYHGVPHSCPAGKKSSGPTDGEPQGPTFQEIDEPVLYQAEALLQADRDAHDGNPEHTLEYYYKQLISKRK